jgi:hypothetical protein
MKIAKVISVIGLVAMTSVLFYGFVFGDFATDGEKLLNNPWGIVSFVDLYVGFILFSMWIVFRERSVVRSVIWVILMMVLGFFTASLYILIALIQSKGDWTLFFLGKRKNDLLSNHK